MWYRHFCNLLLRAWSALLSSLGTTTLSVVIFSIAIPSIVFVLGTLIKWRRAGYAMSRLTEIIKGSWQSILISVGVTLFAWALLFSWALTKTIYKDHEDLVSANISLTVDRDKAKKESSAKDSMISELQKKLNNQQKPTPPRSIVLAASPTFSDSDKIILAQSLASGRGNTVTLYTIGGNEASAVYLQINEAFTKSGWTVQNAGGTTHLNLSVLSNGVMTTPKIEGLFLIAPKPDNAAVRTIVSSFELARHPVSLNGSDVLHPRGEITLYIAFGNQSR